MALGPPEPDDPRRSALIESWHRCGPEFLAQGWESVIDRQLKRVEDCVEDRTFCGDQRPAQLGLGSAGRRGRMAFVEPRAGISSVTTELLVQVDHVQFVLQRKQGWFSGGWGVLHGGRQFELANSTLGRLPSRAELENGAKMDVRGLHSADARSGQPDAVVGGKVLAIGPQERVDACDPQSDRFLRPRISLRADQEQPRMCVMVGKPTRVKRGEVTDVIRH